METIKLSDWLTILAILLAPLVAIQVQKFIERLQERKKRKLQIFHSLMATRGTRISPRHVEALNMIDLEFYGDKYFGYQWQTQPEKAVTEAWKVYLDQLNTPKAPDETLQHWFDKGDELFSKLLSKMAEALSYHFDDVQLKKGAYHPKGHVDIEAAQLTILNGFKDVLNETKSFPMKVTNWPSQPVERDKPAAKAIAPPTSPEQI